MSYLKSVLAQCWTPDAAHTADNLMEVLITSGLVSHGDIERLERDALVYKLSASMTIAQIGTRLNFPTNSIYKMYNRHKRLMRHKTARVA